jgi:hypothetical protein
MKNYAETEPPVNACTQMRYGAETAQSVNAGSQNVKSAC